MYRARGFCLYLTKSALISQPGAPPATRGVSPQSLTGARGVRSSAVPPAVGDPPA